MFEDAESFNQPLNNWDVSIFVTLDTFQLLSGWLKDLANINIESIFVTLDTFHESKYSRSGTRLS